MQLGRMLLGAALSAAVLLPAPAGAPHRPDAVGACACTLSSPIRIGLEPLSLQAASARLRLRLHARTALCGIDVLLQVNGREALLPPVPDSLAAGETHACECELPLHPGERAEIVASCTAATPDGYPAAHADGLVLGDGVLCQADSARVVEAPWGGTGSEYPADIRPSEALAGGLLSSGTIVEGEVRYEDRPFNRLGFHRQTRWLPVRRGTVEVVDAESGEVLSAGTTGEDGSYRLTLPGGARSAYARVWSRVHEDDARVTVRGDHGVYAAVSPEWSLPGGSTQTRNVDISLAGGVAGAFNIFDMAVWTQQFAQNLEAPARLWVAPVDLYWQRGKIDGSYYNAATRSIQLAGVSWNDDSFDDDLILHELGHYVSFVYSLDHNTGDRHYLDGQYHPRLAWSEGWANFWSGAVREWINGVRPGSYSDTHFIVFFWNGFPLSLDREVPAWAGWALHAENELAVQAILWDAYDGPNEFPVDNVEIGIEGIWDIMRRDIPRSPGCVTIEDFFNALVLRHPGATSQIQTLFASRQVLYRKDNHEGDADGETAVPLPYGQESPLRTFYPAGDQDWFTTDLSQGERFVITTSHAKDGAHPCYTVHGPGGDPVASGTGSLEMVADRTGTYRICAQQTSSPSRPGDFGQYKCWFDGEAHLSGIGYGLSGPGARGGSSSGGGGACGSVGLDLMLAAWILALLRRGIRIRRGR